jgi:catechol 2,3-dioxygenase-like lactoylglutathione lyase family enzyme
MFTGAHVLLYTSNADADRAFFRDVLGFRSVDAGHGWLIFGLPPSELAVHPASDGQTVEGELPAALYLMCDDVAATVRMLESKGVACAPLATASWGIRTSFRLPSGGEVGLYQPAHPTAITPRALS